MPTVLDVMREKRVPTYVYTDIKKTDGTALYIWKQRSSDFLSKVNRNFEDKVLALIDFPPEFSRTLSSIVQFHFDRKMNGGKVPWQEKQEEQQQQRKVQKRSRQETEEMALIQKATRENMRAENKLFSTSNTFVDGEKKQTTKKRRIVRRRTKTNPKINLNESYNNFNNY